MTRKLIEKSQQSKSSNNSLDASDGNSVEDLKIKLSQANDTIKKQNEIIIKQKDDIKLLKFTINASNRLCVSKDLKIERLIKGKNDQNKKPKCENILYGKFEHKIDASTLDELRKVSFGQNYDSSFILKLVRHLYAKDHSVLLTKSATGVKNKTAITPSKKSIITDLFRERIVCEENDEVRIALRINRVSTLVNDAINNICRPLKAAAKKSASTTLTSHTNTNAKTNTSASTNTISAEPPPLAPISKKRKLV